MSYRLDHAKINHFTDKKQLKKSRNKRMVQQETYSRVDNVNLAVVTEETVSSIAAGHLVQNQRWNGYADSRTRSRGDEDQSDPTTKADTTGKLALAPPTVILDIEHRKDWIVETEAGSWRRILINLVGNALKYTKSGHVYVSLKSTRSTTTRRQPRQFITLTVSDTGQGISESYLKHRLYSPFSQEDNLSTGAGLGLSIVNGLVSSLQGNIHIDSEMGIGTNVVVTAPISIASEKPLASLTSANDQNLVTTRNLCKDSSICFLGFDVYPAIDAEPSGTMSQSATTMLALKDSLIEMATKWFGLRVTMNRSNATVTVLHKAYADGDKSAHNTEMIPKESSIVVASYSKEGLHDYKIDDRKNYMSAPVGPLKFGRMLSIILQQRSKELPTSTSRSEHPRVQSIITEEAAKAISKAETSIITELATEPPPGTPESAHITSSHKLLLVDDNDINLRILTTLVRKLNIPYISAVNGREAVDRYCKSLEQKDPINCIFMDISMPVMDGLTATRHIRAFEKAMKAKPVKIIALTGLASTKAQQEALASGVDLFFRKPVKIHILRQLLNEDEPLSRSPEQDFDS